MRTLERRKGKLIPWQRLLLALDRHPLLVIRALRRIVCERHHSSQMDVLLYCIHPAVMRAPTGEDLQAMARSFCAGNRNTPKAWQLHMFDLPDTYSTGWWCTKDASC
jgi:hypothetical protein